LSHADGEIADDAQTRSLAIMRASILSVTIGEHRVGVGERGSDAEAGGGISSSQTKT